MIVYSIEKTNNFIRPTDLELKIIPIESSSIFISHSLYHYLTEGKKKIDNNVSQWDHYKKFTNPYEYIHTPPHNSHRAVADYVAISRSFYKMIEIIQYFELLNDFGKTPVRSFHLAEGPGGFIEAMMYLRNGGKNDLYHGMTLHSESKNIPRWNKLQSKFRYSQNIIYEKGPNKTGNLLEPENFTHCALTYTNSMNFITGDGGFDFSIDYEKQELSSMKLVFAQIIYALMMQKKGGHFVVKIFDIFHQGSVELIYLLNSFYTSVTICKPKTSRFANSEKYLVCQGFTHESTSQYYDVLLQMLIRCNDNDQSIHSLFKFDVPRFIIQELEEMNSILGKKQLNTIHTTLMMIQEHRFEKVERLRKSHIEKCIQWCTKNKIPFNSHFKGENIFTRFQHK